MNFVEDNSDCGKRIAPVGSVGPIDNKTDHQGIDHMYIEYQYTVMTCLGRTRIIKYTLLFSYQELELLIY